MTSYVDGRNREFVKSLKYSSTIRVARQVPLSICYQGTLMSPRDRTQYLLRVFLPCLRTKLFEGCLQTVLKIGGPLFPERLECKVFYSE